MNELITCKLCSKLLETPQCKICVTIEAQAELYKMFIKYLWQKSVYIPLYVLVLGLFLVSSFFLNLLMTKMKSHWPEKLHTLMYMHKGQNSIVNMRWIVLLNFNDRFMYQRFISWMWCHTPFPFRKHWCYAIPLYIMFVSVWSMTSLASMF